mmetsp:Transcript_34971/g.64738  ORF Transcript_34971/g.64738 Transcript_34971/m.64738 type:complete len:730 (-) Transcript_34971:83-2272(-)
MTTTPIRRLSEFNDDDAVYDNYIETTIDPGQTLFYVALIICSLSILVLPLLVKIGKYYFPKHKYRDGTKDKEPERPHDEGFFDAIIGEKTVGSVSHWAQKRTLQALQFMLEKGAWKQKRGVNIERRRVLVSQGIANESRNSLGQSDSAHGAFACDDDDVSLDENDVELLMVTTDIIPENDETEDYQPPSIDEPSEPPSRKNDQTQQQPVASPNDSIQRRKRSFDFSRWVRLWSSIVKYDYETKRIIRLVVPFTLSGVTCTMADLICLALISHTIGTDSMVAYMMVDAIVGITSSFTYGWIDSISSLTSMAYGAENYEMVGRYVQTACTIFVLCEIPMTFFWGEYIGKVILWMGFEESVADLAHTYVLISMVAGIIGGLHQAFMDFLEVVEHEAFANALYCVSALVETAFVTLFALYPEVSLSVFGLEPSLFVFGLIFLINTIIFLFIGIIIPYYKGWCTGYFGLYLPDMSVVKLLFNTAMPLAVGGILSYAEWEILIVFAAALGPAEVATWGLLGSIWNVFESTTSSIGSAAEVRCAYQFGQGRPALAKLSAYKSMFLSVLISIWSTAVFLCFSGDIPGWLTKDETIQKMLVPLFPLIALGQVTMTMGMVAWALIGAQGRYRLATSIATGCSLLITTPVAALMTIVWRINLQGLTFAVVIGYTVTAMCMSTVLLMTDWERRAKKITDKMAAEEDSGTDDESEEQKCVWDVHEDGVRPKYVDCFACNYVV